MSIQLSFIGGGVMGEALLSRLIERGLYQAETILVCDRTPDRLQQLQQQYGVQTSTNNAEAMAAEVVMLAIKPQVLDKVVAQLNETNSVKSQSLIVSILAGVPLSRLEAAFPENPVIRAMPNTPATVGAGISAIAPGQNVTPTHLQTARNIFEAVGKVVDIPENLMDAVTGLSGSGPAFVALFVEALGDGGVKAGLPRAIASQLALQTVLGTAQLLQDSQLHPAQLKDRVTSPGGTTIAGVAALEDKGLRSAAIEAVYAAYTRSRELGQ
ncbi:MAG: pyrroline-5-carboxylate reductase [Spirulinaceae cyanobacterium]